jgi:hypothetical protein
MRLAKQHLAFIEHRSSSMQDQHFQRDWCESHQRFSGDIGRALDQLRTSMAMPSSQDRASMAARAVLIGVIGAVALGAALLTSVSHAAPAARDVADPVRLPHGLLALA